MLIASTVLGRSLGVPSPDGGPPRAPYTAEETAAMFTVFEAERRRLAPAIAKFPDCGILPGVGGRTGDCYPGTPPGLQNLPFPGTVEIAGFRMPIMDFRTGTMFRRTYKDSERSAEQIAATTIYWRRANYNRIKEVTNLDNPIKAVLARYPEFTLSYKDLASGVAPTVDEYNGTGGVWKYIGRGGMIYSDKVMGGNYGLIETAPIVCIKWCKSCPSDYWPTGVPQCKMEVDLAPPDAIKYWTLFASRDAPGITTMRLEPTNVSGWKQAIMSVTAKIDAAAEWLCSPEGQTTGAAAASSAGSTGDAYWKLVGKTCSGVNPSQPITSITAMPTNKGLQPKTSMMAPKTSQASAEPSRAPATTAPFYKSTGFRVMMAAATTATIAAFYLHRH